MMTTRRHWQWLDHIKDQMDERGITSEIVEDALANPDAVVQGKKSRVIYQKLVMDKLLRVVTEGNKLITVYLTSKIRKYMKGDEE